MLRLKVIQQWSDFRTEVNSVIMRLESGEAVNLNLLRRSIVAWKRAGTKPESPQPVKQGSRHVSLNFSELDELEVTFRLVNEAVYSLSVVNLKRALDTMVGVIVIVEGAYMRSRTDREILTIVNTTGPLSLGRGVSKASRIEAARRCLV